MFVTIDEYLRFGYCKIPVEIFERHIMKAGYMVERWTLGRVTDETLNPGDMAGHDTALIERNKRGICEIAELMHVRDDLKAVGESGAPIKSFSNEGYSETLAAASVQDSAEQFERDAWNILDVYFTQEQLCRRGGA